ncbi:zinc finger CCCH domain-containing protein 2-like [Salvia miltiorrhiza]|uniref:zinc finger CCCH domain-containing protein 2-like n=1 Tax=Salvia miltiorrhiza TaxID=226208 RepID=UPI0025AD003E|nr:zinc finger CCCH domain-containing protein 2-like [Salvia miltiorrhiza]
MPPRTSLPILSHHPRHLSLSHHYIPIKITTPSPSLSHLTPNLIQNSNNHPKIMMGSVCAEQQHKFHHSHQLLLTKKALRDIDIPPRKQLLLSRSSPRSGSGGGASDAAELHSSAASFSKFLPYNDGDEGGDEDGDDPYSSDHFRMYEFKVRKCNRSRSHDWTDCPFAHPGEKARRRDPRRHHYSGSVCPDFRKGHCGKGDACELSHGVFECWLHPSRYRTEACKDGRSCKRKVCFFAHSSRQLRIVPDPTPAPASPTADHPKLSHHCCMYCHCSMTASPTSTLIPHMSPPLSPPISPYGRSAAYKDALADLMASFEAMSAGEAASPSPSTPGAGSLAWLDVNLEEQPQFVMSPSAAPPRGARKFYSGQSKLKFEDYSGGEANAGGPDLGWVNDLLT